MTRGGAPGDNAHMESFFDSLKANLAWYPLPDRGWTPLRTPMLSLVLQLSTPALGLGHPIAR
jgi:hypothetical protein